MAANPLCTWPDARASRLLPEINSCSTTAVAYCTRNWWRIARISPRCHSMGANGEEKAPKWRANSEDVWYRPREGPAQWRGETDFAFCALRPPVSANTVRTGVLPVCSRLLVAGRCLVISWAGRTTGEAPTPLIWIEVLCVCSRGSAQNTR